MNEIKPRKSPLDQEVKIYRVLFVLILCLVIGEGVFLYKSAYSDTDDVTYEYNEVMLQDDYNDKKPS